MQGTMESNQPQDGSTNHNVSSTSTEVAEHPGSEHHHNKVNDIKEKPSAKKIMKKWKNLKDRMSK